MIADGNTLWVVARPRGARGSSVAKAMADRQRALPDLHPANARGLEMLSGAPLDEFGDLREQLYRKVESTPSGGCLHQLRRPADQCCL